MRWDEKPIGALLFIVLVTTYYWTVATRHPVAKALPARKARYVTLLGQTGEKGRDRGRARGEITGSGFPNAGGSSAD
ncbi:MAG: hypothetical protein Lm2023SU_00970 [Serratia ureilytica]